MRMAIGIVLVLVLALTAFADPRAAMREGVRAFEKGEFARAAHLFEQAASNAAPSGLDPTVPLLNEGVALFRSGNYGAAADLFLQARLTPDLDRQARALYNAATARLKQVETALASGDGRDIERHLNEAIEWLSQSLIIRPDREDTRHQLEVALAHRDLLQGFLIELSVVLQTAERLLDDHRFEEAHRVLLAAKERLGPALILPKEEAKSFAQLLERTGQIVQILQTATAGGTP